MKRDSPRIQGQPEPSSVSDPEGKTPAIIPPQQPKKGVLGAFISLRQRNFRLFWFGQMNSLYGDSLCHASHDDAPNSHSGPPEWARHKRAGALLRRKPAAGISADGLAVGSLWRSHRHAHRCFSQPSGRGSRVEERFDNRCKTLFWSDRGGVE